MPRHSRIDGAVLVEFTRSFHVPMPDRSALMAPVTRYGRGRKFHSCLGCSKHTRSSASAAVVSVSLLELSPANICHTCAVTDGMSIEQSTVMTLLADLMELSQALTHLFTRMESEDPHDAATWLDLNRMTAQWTVPAIPRVARSEAWAEVWEIAEQWRSSMRGRVNEMLHVLRTQVQFSDDLSRDPLHQAVSMVVAAGPSLAESHALSDVGGHCDGSDPFETTCTEWIAGQRVGAARERIVETAAEQVATLVPHVHDLAALPCEGDTARPGECLHEWADRRLREHIDQTVRTWVDRLDMAEAFMRGAAEIEQAEGPHGDHLLCVPWPLVEDRHAPLAFLGSETPQIVVADPGGTVDVAWWGSVSSSMPTGVALLRVSAAITARVLAADADVPCAAIDDGGATNDAVVDALITAGIARV